MVQTWGTLLFMHWPLDAGLLRPHIPPSLEIDTFDGTAWIGVIPFTMWGIRRVYLPPLPGLSAMHELNVRTYVHHEGVPGVWFFSLDAASKLAVRIARRFYHLPYFDAAMTLEERGGRIHYTARRTHRAAPPAAFEATWSPGVTLEPARETSLPFFLTERYCLYAAHQDRLYRARIHHEPWPLRSAVLHDFQSTMLAAHDLPEPTDPPLLHYADELHVDIWPLKHIGPTA